MERLDRGKIEVLIGTFMTLKPFSETITTGSEVSPTLASHAEPKNVRTETAKDLPSDLRGLTRKLFLEAAVREVKSKKHQPFPPAKRPEPLKKEEITELKKDLKRYPEGSDRWSQIDYQIKHPGRYFPISPYGESKLSLIKGGNIMELKPFSEDITTGSPEQSPIDTFAKLGVFARRKLANQWGLILTSARDLEAGYKRIHTEWDIEEPKIDEIVDDLIAGKEISKDDEEIVVLGWPKIFKDMFGEKNIVPKGEYYHPKKGWY